MRRKRADRALQAPTSQSERPPGRCRFAVSTGSLRVQPAGPTLSPEDTARLLGQLRGWQARGDLKELVFDLSQIETIGPQWTVVLALLIGFTASKLAAGSFRSTVNRLLWWNCTAATATWRCWSRFRRLPTTPQKNVAVASQSDL